MTVTRTTSSERQQGNGTTTIFTYNIKLLPSQLGTNDITVRTITRATDEVATTLAFNGGGSNGYTASYNNDTEQVTVTTNTAPLATEDLQFLRRTEITQETDLPIAGRFASEDVENALDRLTINVQEIQTDVNRAVKLPDTSTGQIILPSYEADRVLTWSSTETNVLVNQVGIPADIVDGQVTTAKLADGAVTNAKLDNLAVTTAKLDNDAVTTDKILDGAITKPKLSFATLDVVVQVITASGTYTPTAGMVKCLVEVQGGGGGGGGCPAAPVNTGRAAGGGGGGGYARRLLTVVEIGASQSVTIGAGGAGGSASADNGNSGGSSTFGAYITCTGGAGGQFGGVGSDTGDGGAGGVGSGGDYNTNGQFGSDGDAVNNNDSASISGQGGSSYFGGGGPSGYTISSKVGRVGAASGSGGSGSANFPSGAAAAGGNGANGVIIITEFIG